MKLPSWQGYSDATWDGLGPLLAVVAVRPRQAAR